MNFPGNLTLRGGKSPSQRRYLPLGNRYDIGLIASETTLQDETQTQMMVGQ